MGGQRDKLTRTSDQTGVSTLGFVKTLIVGIMLGCLLGLWLGINIGKDRPLLANPFDTAATTSILE
ncbi:MAG TPA: hypothetical protein DD979_07645 [Gammaproteobacteria bacterium]|nr:hypothetical protein [Gammaproteobacteria bacterium]